MQCTGISVCGFPKLFYPIHIISNEKERKLMIKLTQPKKNENVDASLLMQQNVINKSCNQIG